MAFWGPNFEGLLKRPLAITEFQLGPESVDFHRIVQFQSRRIPFQAGRKRAWRFFLWGKPAI
jgi:hypothetical protein